MATKSIKAGTKFNATYADSNPQWEVTRSRGRGVWEAKIVSPDYAGEVKVFTTEEITRSLAWTGMFAKLESEGDAFYASLKPGTIVHYHNGFQEYVRCEAVKVGNEMKLKPVALVGEWNKRDLPHRLPSGEVSKGYHADKVIKGEAWKPSISCVYECSRFSKGGRIDPRALPAIDLTIQAPTAEETEKARLTKALDDAYKALNEREPGNPKAALEKALAVIQAALAA